MRFVLVLAAAALLSVFDDCGNTDASLKPPPPPPPPPPSKPWCYTDPPVGCVAMCVDVGTIDFIHCDGPAAGPVEAVFEQRVEQLAMTQTEQPCPAGTVGLTVTPCMVGITPQLQPPNQDTTVCTVAPPGCVTGG
jgi:hypothetical protein